MTSTNFDDILDQPYKYGFVSDIESDTLPPGLNEDVIHFISAKKEEPQFMLDFRLKTYRHWLTLEEPDWAKINYPKPDFQKIIYYSAPKEKKKLGSLDEVDPAIIEVYNKL